MSWVKLHRQFLEWEWFDSAEMVKVFLYLLLAANFEDRKWHGDVVRRGQLLTSWEQLSKATKLSVQRLRTCLAKLESTGEITRKSTSQHSIITVCNYDRYQEPEEEEQQATNKQSTNEQQTSNKQSTTTKELKNIDKEKDISKDISKKKEQSAPVSPEEFVEMWNEGRGNCPKVIKLSDKRKAKAKSRISEFGKTREEQEATIRSLMEKIKESDFLQYQWNCNFEWLIDNPDNWVKVIEGNYKNRTEPNRKDRTGRMQDTMREIDEIFGYGKRDTEIPEEQ